jgi:large subunit ribosomal protein L2
MGIKKYRPLTPGLRFKTSLTFEEVTKKHPEKALTKGKPKHAGRGAGGRISARTGRSISAVTRSAFRAASLP